MFFKLFQVPWDAPCDYSIWLGPFSLIFLNFSRFFKLSQVPWYAPCDYSIWLGPFSLIFFDFGAAPWRGEGAAEVLVPRSAEAEVGQQRLAILHVGRLHSIRPGMTGS